MVVTQLLGGLGNQMFQYAMARNVAQMHGVPLKLDITAFKDYQLRQYELACFNIRAEIATDQELARFSQGKLARALEPITNRLWPYFKQKVVKEQSFTFDSKIRKVSPPVYLTGYWQSEKYFLPMAQTIREEFSLKSPLSLESLTVKDLIQQCNAVSLHVRRGDYVSNSATSAFHGVCSLQYYADAVAHIATSVSQPHFFVFSDDSAWVEENIKVEFPATYVTHNRAERSFEDMYLMSACKHHIIANSSFSWWGAWLNPDPGKIVIAPAQWFKNSNMDTRDLIPEGWQTL